MPTSETKKAAARRYHALHRDEIRQRAREKHRAKVASGWKPTEEHILKRRHLAKLRRVKNRDSIRAYENEWRKKHLSSCRASSLNSYYRTKSTVPAHVLRKKWSEIKKKQYHSSLSFRISLRLKCRVRRVLLGVSKSAPTLAMLGCSLAQFMAHLEKYWEPGMSWVNYGSGENKWNIDHVKPCAAFDLSSDIEQKICFHFSNLRPCWHRTNISKGSFWNGRKHRYKKETEQIG
jgi:hypothetical protein